MRSPVTDVKMPSREELEALRDEGYTRERIAQHYGVPLSRVKRWLKKLGFGRAERRIPAEPTNLPAADLPFDSGLTIMEKAKLILGSRLREDRHLGYLLDGRVANTEKIIAAARLKAVKTD